MSTDRDGVVDTGVNDGSVSLLRERLQEADYRRSLLGLVDFASLMRGCVINRTYSLPDTLAAPVQLSSLGRDVFDRIRTEKPRLKRNDVKFGLLLAFGCPGGLLVDANSDLEALRKGLSVELLKQKILFPYIFGRDLHDAAADRYPEKHTLTVEESVNLLKSLPIGVFQEGYTTTGPFGCLEADAPRMLYSRINVPGYFCSDQTCFSIHGLQLNTANEAPHLAPANKALHYVSDYLTRRYGNVEDYHARILRDAHQIEMNSFVIGSPESVVEVVADGLDNSELRSVAEGVLKRGLKQHGAKSLSLRLSAVIANPTTFVGGLTRPHLLQLILLFSDESLSAAVDECVRSGAIKTTQYEVRSRKMSRFGSGGVQAEIGSRGLRLTGGGSFVASRLLELLHHLYYDSVVLTSDDLAYLIGASEGDAEGSYVLDHAVRRLSPEALLRTLVLGSRQAHKLASSFLGLPDETGDKDELLQMLLWKLGASSSVAFQDMDRVRRYEAELASGISSKANQDELRGHISNLFAAIEGSLRTSLEFAIWVLTNDHFLEENSFVYDPAPKPERLQFIEEHSPTTDVKLRLELNGKNSLVALGAGFSRLSKALGAQVPDSTLRPEDQIPLVCRESGQPFAFRHTLPFHDLSEKARAATVDALQSVSRLIQDEVVLKTRNAAIHGSQHFPTEAELRLAAEKIGVLRSTLSTTGLYPSVFRLTDSTTDVLGRKKFRYEGSDAPVFLYQPSWAIAPKIPTGPRQLVVLPLCDTVASGPLRFRLKNRPGGDPYWDGWPRRWRVTEQYGVATHEALAEMKEAGTG